MLFIAMETKTKMSFRVPFDNNKSGAIILVKILMFKGLDL